MKADELRQKYLEFFRSKGHKVAESDSLVPKDDPTVLFTPAGMNQFKKQFLGMVTDFRRAASSQRCLRTDDLDKVGKTDCHHTFFEMLGNFSFGDYFKKDAIAWAWEFLTKDLAIAPDRLWVSVYKDDDEAYDIWKNDIRVPAARIVRLGDHDNFWPADAKEKGPNGPCGPCSEIFIDLGRDVGCGKPDCSPACSCGRFIEIWNLVFTQFNRKDGGVLEPLPQKNIDTGMGLERITAVMQGVTNNFMTDLFQPMIRQIKASAAKNQDAMQEMFAVTDHLRAAAFSIYDGVLPSNEGRGYVVRKLIRKSVLHLRGLGIEKPFLYTLVPVLAETMKKPYPELARRRGNIADVILSEEKNFINTLNSSDSLLKEKFSGKPGAEEAGAVAFQLYDTYGIPLELTRDWLAKNGLSMSMPAFEKAMAGQKERSKTLSAMKGDVFSVTELNLKGLPRTQFLGYERFETTAKVLKVIRDPKDAALASVVLDKTVFYAESGGQIHDVGILSKDGLIFSVTGVEKEDDIFVHTGTLKGDLKEGDTVEAKIDVHYRMSVARNHTATHLLQSALRAVLGQHVQQQGSMVDQDRLRFDFTHFKDVSDEELARVEKMVNEFVLANMPVHKKEMDLADARQEGALAFFGEKYGEKVRVVSIGDVSKEFCGGTHLDMTGSIGLFTVISESSVASGVRRIEARTGIGAYETVKAHEEMIAAAAQLLKSPRDKVVGELEKRLAHIKELEKEVASQKTEKIKTRAAELVKKAETVGGRGFIGQVLEGLDMNLLRAAVDAIRQKTQNSVIVLGTSQEGKAYLVVALTPDLAKGTLNAQKLVQAAAPVLGGSGGGRPDFAQAGGPRTENLMKAIEEVKKTIA
ncbi:MAG: alanine--tRNA ligase [Deltaproteobacteria bacterium]